jgi:uroporphyrinogen-III synthase
MKRLIILRPEPGASETLARARALGLNAITIPLFAVEPVVWDVPDARAFDGLLLTSVNAARYGGPNLTRLKGLPVYAVGKATAAGALAAGFTVAATGTAGVNALIANIDPRLRMLHLCGEDRMEAGVAAQITVYRARALEGPDLGGVGEAVALVHSPRAGRRLAELVPERGSIAIAAISDAAAAAVGGGWAEVAAAERPTGEALLALAVRLCNKPGT